MVTKQSWKSLTIEGIATALIVVALMLILVWTMFAMAGAPVN